MHDGIGGGCGATIYHTRHTLQHTATPDEIERLLHHMPTVARLVGNERAAGFARSLVKQTYRGGKAPSPKHLFIMRGLASGLFTLAPAPDQGDIQLNE